MTIKHSVEDLRKHLALCADTGRLWWKADGRPAMDTINTHGYKYGWFGPKRMKQHRAIFAMVHGYFPKQVDHINGDRTDNRPSNLRAADSFKNTRNKKLSSLNTSGTIGVSFDNTRGKWRALINTVEGKRKHIGWFDSKDQAILARKEMEDEHEYHENHGRYDATV